MICGSAYAALYSCVDDSGASVLKNTPCSQAEKQQLIGQQKVSPYSSIDSSGGIQRYAIQNASENNTTQQNMQTTVEKCEVIYQKTIDKHSTGTGANRYPYIQMWHKLGCKSHCEDMLNILMDTQAGEQKKETAASMFDVCQ
jgi:hypothetical protein